MSEQMVMLPGGMTATLRAVTPFGPHLFTVRALARPHWTVKGFAWRRGTTLRRVEAIAHARRRHPSMRWEHE
jgi:hypothetical protein